jgi:hypothetical protein
MRRARLVRLRTAGSPGVSHLPTVTALRTSSREAGSWFHLARTRACARATALFASSGSMQPKIPGLRPGAVVLSVHDELRRPFVSACLEPRERLPAPGAQRSLTKEFARRRVRLSRGVRAGETTRTHLAARRALPLVGFRGAPGTRPGRTRTVIGSVRPVRRFDAHRVHVLPGCTRPKPCAAPPALSRPFRGPSRQPRTGRPTRGVVARCFLS